MPDRLSRRAFLATSLVLVGGGLTLSGVELDLRSLTKLGDRLRALLAGRDAVKELGAVYLAATPGEADAPRLLRLLAADLGWRARFAGREELRRLVAERVRDDFAAERLARIHGWVLSRTEARLCALVALPPASGEPA